MKNACTKYSNMTEPASTAGGQKPPRTPRGRTLLLPVKDSEVNPSQSCTNFWPIQAMLLRCLGTQACEAALKWTLEHLHRQGM